MYVENEEYPKALNNFIKNLYTSEKSLNTIELYSNHLVEFFKFIKYNKKINKDVVMNTVKINKITYEELNEITSDNIDDYKLYLIDVRKNSSKTINNKLAALDSFYTFCSSPKKQIIKTNVMDYITRNKEQKRTVIEALEPEEAIKLLETIKTSNKKFMVRDHAIYSLFLNTGIRCSELCDITVNEIKKLVSVVNITGKGNKVRGIYFNKDCIKAIEKYLPFREEMLETIEVIKEDKDKLFFSQQGKKLTEANLNKTLKIYVELAGMNPNDVHVHTLRHTYATIAYNNGMDIYELKKVLGHSDIKTVLIYAEMGRKKLKNAMNNFSLVTENEMT